MPFIVNDVGLLVGPRRTVVISVFTAKNNLAGNTNLSGPYIEVARRTNLLGPYIEDAIGRIAEQVANYFAYQ